METHFDVNNNPIMMVRMKRKKKKRDRHTGSGLTGKGGDRAKIKGKGLTERQPYTNDLQHRSATPKIFVYRYPQCSTCPVLIFHPLH